MDSVNYCLITAGNPNTSTVYFVANEVEKIAGGKIKQVFLIGNDETNESNGKIYKECLKKGVLLTSIGMNLDGTINDDLLIEIGKIAKNSRIIIDLANGQKTTISYLYLIGCFLDTDLIYASRDIGNRTFVYEKVSTFKDISNLSKLANIDLIRYNGELNLLRN